MTGLLWVKAAAVATAGVVVGGGVAVVLTEDAGSAVGPVAQAWVDQPLHASGHPLGPIEVTVHATDVDTVVALEVSVGGEIIDIDIDDPAALVWQTFEWTPDAAGRYQLEVVGEDPKGDVGVAGIATFTVGGIGDDAATTTSSTSSSTSTSSPSSSTTSTSSPTIPPTTSSTTSSSTSVTTPPPTPTPPTSCSPSTPTVIDADTESIDSSGAVVRITWTYAGCAPNGFSVIVSYPRNAPITQNVGAAPRSTTFELQTCTEYTVRVQALGVGSSPSSAPYEFATDCG